MVKGKKKCKLVLGNGFDLYCGLNTRYKDFFNSQKDKLNLIDQWCKNIENGVFNFIKSEIDNNLFVLQNSLADDVCFWDLLFYFDPKIDKKSNWYDVEQFILDLFINEDISKETTFDSLYNNVKNGNRMISSNCSWIEYPCIYLKNNKFNVKTKIDFATHLLDELNKFEKQFGEYVHNEFISKLFQVFNSKCKTFYNQIESIWDVVSIDTFNYTPLESLSDDLCICSDIIHHVNGDYNQPIFGIDSSKLTISKPGYIFTKTYRRMTADFFEGEKKSCILEEEFDDIVIFGHSLNEQDYNYYFPLFDYINLMDINSNKGIYFYYYIYDPNKRRNIKNTNVKNLVKMLNAYEKYKTNKDKDFRLVDTLSSQGRLRFKEVR